MSDSTSTGKVDFKAEIAEIIDDAKHDLGNPPYTTLQWLQIAVGAFGQFESLVAKYGSVQAQYEALVAEATSAVHGLVTQAFPHNGLEWAVRLALNTRVGRLVEEEFDRMRARLHPAAVQQETPATTTTTPAMIGPGDTSTTPGPAAAGTTPSAMEA